MSNEPKAYQVGWQPFLGLKIWLDSRPLIPRPETEWWMEKLLGEVPKQFSGALRGASPSLTPKNRSTTPPLRFLDLCAGSGAIGCAALKALPYVEVFLMEVDPAHEATIRKNIAENDLDMARAHVTIGDLFAPFPAGLTFDVIAANPPYVPQNRALPPEVANYEPALALRAGADGLALIRHIALGLPHRLAKGGVAWIECDAERAEEARSLFEAQSLAAEIMHDQYGRPRVITVSWRDD